MFYVCKCTNPNCDVITYKWRKPGDACPSCRWLGEHVSQ